MDLQQRIGVQGEHSRLWKLVMDSYIGVYPPDTLLYPQVDP